MDRPSNHLSSLARRLAWTFAAAMGLLLVGCDGGPDTTGTDPEQEGELVEEELGRSGDPLQQRLSPEGMSPGGPPRSPGGLWIEGQDGGVGPGLPGGDRREPDPIPWKLPAPNATANDA